MNRSKPLRYAYLVGSLPFENEEIAMQKAMAILGTYLRSLPDGEVGNRVRNRVVTCSKTLIRKEDK